jgi:hypothetical protein
LRLIITKQVFIVVLVFLHKLPIIAIEGYRSKPWELPGWN